MKYELDISHGVLHASVVDTEDGSAFRCYNSHDRGEILS